MSDIKLFRFTQDHSEELAGRSALVERELHDLMEKHMECFLGIRFVAHEYSTGKNHRGRIDSLGLDENCCPVIIEYKRQTNENVINQGLYYLDWLLDHKAEFQLLVMERFGKETADMLEWSGPRVLCVAGDFTKFDEHAVAQIGRNIELIRYKYFADNLLMLEWINPIQARPQSVTAERVEEITTKPTSRKEITFADNLAALSGDFKRLYDDVFTYITSLGDDINAKTVKYYLAFSRLKNFTCLAIFPQGPHLKLWLKLDPSTTPEEAGFIRHVHKTGHWGTGDVEIIIRDADDFAKAKTLIERAYQEN